MVARLGDKVVSLHSHINIEAMGGSRGCLQHMPPQLAVFWLEVIDAGQVEAGNDQDLDLATLLERRDGAWLGIEVKMGSALIDEAATALRLLASGRVVRPRRHYL